MPGMRIPDRLVLAVCAFGDELPAERAARALALGIRSRGGPEPDICPIVDALPSDLDARMRDARAVVVGAERLDRQTLPASPVFEIATRARQAGVPAYAVAGFSELDAFDARMLDLQVVLKASTVRGLSAAGRKLAQLL
jgi:Glycerate kinase family